MSDASMQCGRLEFVLALCRVSALALVVTLAGCAGEKRVVRTDEELMQRASADASSMMQAVQEGVTKLMARIESEKDGNGEATLDILAMSGGGDYGAFGAGILHGWGTIEDPNWTRPDFDAVTGVSTGAMLAPFAYVGTDEAIDTVETFYRNPKKDWVKERGLLFFLPKNPSFATLPGLQRDVRGVISPEFVEQMAEASRSGKVLGISATDLDFHRQKFWEVGKIAEEAAASGDPARVQDIMLASAAIPIVFPPIGIEDQIYADGGVTANVLLKLDTKNPNALIPRWLKEHPGEPLPKVRYWIIINNQAVHPPATTQPRWPAIAGPSLETAIRSATIAEIRWLAAEADYVNVKYDANIEVRVIAIPANWKPPVKGDFQKETMESLSDLGRQMGANPKSWQLWTLPVE